MEVEFPFCKHTCMTTYELVDASSKFADSNLDILWWVEWFLAVVWCCAHFPHRKVFLHFIQNERGSWSTPELALVHC